MPGQGLVCGQRNDDCAFAANKPVVRVEWVPGALRAKEVNVDRLQQLWAKPAERLFDRKKGCRRVTV